MTGAETLLVIGISALIVVWWYYTRDKGDAL